MDQSLQLAFKEFQHLWKHDSFPPKTILLKEGDIARKIYQIKKGCIRTWFNHDGKDISFQFFFEGDSFASVESFNKQTPSPYAIETIEQTDVRWLVSDDLEQMRQHPLINTFLMDRAIDRQAAFIQHFFSFLRDTPKQRYQNLLAERPQVVQRVPLQYIASYLGITQVSLSRIRAQIK
ncbi:Crp/Fnr family transcriptional regulator [Chitinophaga sancti]|uniref:Crp/Fnr family transcriptional regulator n=1 Tax=Chitinophaga sancti TaxID=1004 RepID=A0A1K1R3B8_9BACT|nr:Crp/Fnr family transcriptional regulator [Chitinophaga sancti]WQD64359.1 Crp/Fnr family transcriptional regulator [Chitinophaga sancti]WQG90017.1 Crp/Fnr family transcriptional regulator [Chitinophaga sancti]SFW66078.1 cAMP-binding domain of CRP or a regulatory subunit of cAMP-dependent protein kinases [Chitinophaga sancti]